MKELIGIIASYWGCECSYSLLKHPFQGVVDWNVLKMASSMNVFPDFKLHLKKLEDITEEDAEVACNAFGWYGVDDIDATFKGLLLNSIKDPSYGIKYLDYLNAFTKLRSLGYCVDEILVEKGFVDFK